jgi:putative endonuclease
MYHVYLLRSIKNSEKTYIGYTTNMKQRLAHHNEGASEATTDFKPWKLVVCVSFDEESKAREFERYLKVGSGHAFAKRRLW